MNCTRVTLRAFAAAFFTLISVLNISESFAQDNENFEYESRETSPIERKVMNALQAMDYSKGRIVLLAGSEIQNLRGVEKFLVGLGYIAEVVYPTNEPGPLQVRSDQFAVFVNEKFGGIYGQYSVGRGIGADIEVFARSSGLEPTSFLQ